MKYKLEQQSVLELIQDKYSYLLNKKHLYEYRYANNKKIWNEYYEFYIFLLNNIDNIKINDLEIIDAIIQAIEYVDDFEFNIKDISFYYNYINGLLYLKIKYNDIILQYNNYSECYDEISNTIVISEKFDKDSKLFYNNLDNGINIFYNLAFDIQ